jgi:hypothetical protein
MHNRRRYTAPKIGGRKYLGPVLNVLMMLLLPVGIVIVFTFIVKALKLDQYFKSLRDMITGGSQGGAAAIDAAQAAVDKTKELLKKKAIEIQPVDQQRANTLYNAINTANLWRGLFGMRSLNVDQSKEIKELFTKVWDINSSDNWEEQYARLYAAYGVRTVNNRQSVLLGFVWDETSGTVVDHIQRYINSDLEAWKVDVLNNFQQGINIIS